MAPYTAHAVEVWSEPKDLYFFLGGGKVCLLWQQRHHVNMLSVKREFHADFSQFIDKLEHFIL